MPRISRFKRRNSDRSGFRYYEIELIKDNPWLVAGDEYDQPPPSRRPLGGEGDRSTTSDQRTNADFATVGILAVETAGGLDNPTIYVTAAAGITPSFTHPWMRITGSNGAVTLTAVPQIARGRQDQVLTLQGVDSAVTLAHGSANALNLMGSTRVLQLVSGAVLTVIFNTGNQAWNEASRSF